MTSPFHIEWAAGTGPIRRSSRRRRSHAEAYEELIGEFGMPEFPSGRPAKDFFCELLRVAAEVEHEFICEYLYAAYSLAGDNPWRRTLSLLAREEMGHWLTVQNLLLALGEAPHLALPHPKDDNPWMPFRPARLPFTRRALGRFLVAESPVGAVLPPRLKAPTRRRKRHVGVAYMTLYWMLLDGSITDRWLDFPAHLFQKKYPKLDAGISFVQGSQASAEDWGSPAPPTESHRLEQDLASRGADLIIHSVRNRADAAGALRRIAAQGEGPNEPRSRQLPSHFDRLCQIFAEASSGRSSPGAGFARGKASNSVVRLAGRWGTVLPRGGSNWGELIALRYNLIVVEVLHALLLPAFRRAERELAFQRWLPQDMGLLKDLANRLDWRNPSQQAQPAAGPPLILDGELPQTTEGCVARMRALLRESRAVVKRIGRAAAPALIDAVMNVDAARTDYLKTL